MAIVRTPEIEEEIIKRLSKGEPMAVICRDDHMPSDRAVRYWQKEDAEFASAIARAREDGFDQIALDGLRIVDDITEDPASRRVRADYRLKLLAKWDPRRYGDLVKLSGADGSSPLQVVMQNYDPDL